MRFLAPVLITKVRDQFVALLREAVNASNQLNLSRKASLCDLLCIDNFAHSNREMRCTRGLQANQALQKLQLRGVQLTKTQMERLASSAMARFLYKAPSPCFMRSNAVDAQSLNAQVSSFPKSWATCATRAQACGRENSSLVLNGFGRAVTGQGFRNFVLSARRGYLLGRSSRGIVSARASGIPGKGKNGFDGESPDASFFGKAIFMDGPLFYSLLDTFLTCSGKA